jgi:type II secretory pathway pseudopilin PulG
MNVRGVVPRLLSFGDGRVRRRLCFERGSSLLEAIVAITVGSLVIVAIARGLVGAMHGGRSARTTTQATALARAALESGRALGWPALAHATGATAADPRVSGGSFDPDGAGALPPEEVVESDDGGLVPYVSNTSAGATTYTVTTYVTDAGDSVRRVTSLVEWKEEGRSRDVTLSTLVPSGTQDVGASALVLSGTVLGSPSETVARAEAGSSGGSESRSAGAFSLPQLAPLVTGTGALATATVSIGPAAHSEASFASIDIGLPGLTISASSVTVQADSVPGSMTASASGSVTINGVPYANPAPGTSLSIAGYRISLNDQRREAGGALSVTFLRVEGPDTEVRAAWAWVRPVEYLDV